MTPEEARGLYDTARTPDEVVALLSTRKGRQSEVNVINSLRSLYLSDPARTLRIIRGVAEEHERSAVNYRTALARHVDQGDVERAQRARNLAEDRDAAGKALRWAAACLTRGMAGSL